MSKIILEEQASPSTPAANKVALYPKSDGHIYSMDDAGTEYLLAFDPASPGAIGETEPAAGSFTTLDVSGLTASRALQTNGSKALESSAVTTTELGYVSGVSSAIQTQLNGKASTAHKATHITGGADELDADQLTSTTRPPITRRTPHRGRCPTPTTCPPTWRASTMPWGSGTGWRGTNQRMPTPGAGPWWA